MGSTMYAIIRSGDKQFRAEPGMTVRVPALSADVGDTVTFDEVLLASTEDGTTVGTPTVANATVTGEVVRHGKDKKGIIFKWKRRKNYRRKQGHRQKFTEVRIGEIKVGRGRERHGTQEGSRLQPQRPRFESAVPRRKALWWRAGRGGQHPGAAARHEVPPGSQRRQGSRRHTLRAGRRRGEVRALRPQADAGLGLSGCLTGCVCCNDERLVPRGRGVFSWACGRRQRTLVPDRSRRSIASC